MILNDILNEMKNIVKIMTEVRDLLNALSLLPDITQWAKMHSKWYGIFGDCCFNHIVEDKEDPNIGICRKCNRLFTKRI